MEGVPQATVAPGADGKSFRVLLDGQEIGTAKSDTDARFHMHAINAAITRAYDIGVEVGRE